jgi:DNA polymerase III epsilon subunit-like protein
MSKLIFVDVEATGMSPINGTMTEFGAVDYKTRQTFHGVIWESRPAEDNPAVSVITGKLLNPVSDVMSNFVGWLAALGKDRPIFVSDNPAYDYQWINAAFDSCGLENPFGHSARRISDFWAGLQRNWSDTQSWKRFRITPHDHNPVNDALGNVEAFEQIMQLLKAQPTNPER